MQKDLVNETTRKEGSMAPVDFDSSFLSNAHKKALEMQQRNIKKDVMLPPFISVRIEIKEVGEPSGGEFKVLAFPDVSGEVRLFN